MEFVVSRVVELGHYAFATLKLTLALANFPSWFFHQ
jgi:hypothetical protein